MQHTTHDLMFGCLGNGITVFDRAREENNDYKTIAHIAAFGGIKLYDCTYPSPALEQIYQQARNAAETFRSAFLLKTIADMRLMILNSMTLKQSCCHTPLPTEPDQLYDEYIRIVCTNTGYTMPPERP